MEKDFERIFLRNTTGQANYFEAVQKPPEIRSSLGLEWLNKQQKVANSSASTFHRNKNKWVDVWYEVL